MKVLHVITGLKIGGAETVLYNFLAEAAKQNKVMHVVAYLKHGVNVAKIQALGVTTHNLYGERVSLWPLSFYKLYRLIKQEKPDVIHSSLWAANIMSRLLGRITGIPVVCDLHGNSIDEGKVRNFFDRATLGFAHRIIAVADGVADTYKKNIIATFSSVKKKEQYAKKITVIKNGLDVDALYAAAQQDTFSRESLNIGKDDFVIGAIGRFEPIKSYDILIRAFSEFLKNYDGKQQAILCMVGDGSQRVLLEELVHKLGISKQVLFVGFQDNCHAWYPLFDCFALSSQSEGLSIALLSAMALGLPIITTNKDDRHEVVQDGVNGLLIPVNDVTAYYHGLMRLYNKVELRVEMGVANKELLAVSFDINTVVKNYYDVYRDVVLR